jgi:uncharacterized NAD(P)/FAD-binding protein YdhS
LQETVTELKDNILTKESEISVLQDYLKQLKNASDEEGDNILQALLDVGRCKAELKLVTIERDTLAEKLQDEVDARKLLEGKVQNTNWYLMLLFSIISQNKMEEHLNIFQFIIFRP